MSATVEEILVTVARDVGARSAAGSAGTEFSRGETLFATANGNIADFRLEPEIAEAAMRTTGTTGSARGSGWVRLELAELTPIADRARAWFLSAYRYAERAD